MNYLKFVGSTTTVHSKKWGELLIESASFTPAVDGDLVIYVGSPSPETIPFVRIHSECVFAEAFDSDFCDCAEQLHLSMNLLQHEQNGILFYLRLDGRGAGLSAKVAATHLEVEGLDTYESRVRIGVNPEGRDFTKIGKFLREKGYREIRLLTNNPNKIRDLESTGLVVKVESLYVEDPNDHIKKLYQTKVERFHHQIPTE